MRQLFILISIVVGIATSRASAEQADARPVFAIAHAADLEETAKQWGQYRQRQGWRIVTLAVQPDEDLSHQRDIVQKWIRDQHAQATAEGAVRLVVLLLGDEPAAPGASGIAAWRFPQNEPTLKDRNADDYISDLPYQLIDADPLPDVALGRIPARTDEEARAVLQKIQLYEANATLDFWRSRIHFVAGEGRFGQYDALMENLFRQMIDRHVPEAYEIDMLYAKSTSMYCPPPHALRNEVVARLRKGSLLFNYLGHGFPTGFDSLHWNDERFPILKREDLNRLTGWRDNAPIALLTCCSAGWFDLPDGEQSLAEAMILNTAGPVAVMAGSRQTHPYCNGVLQKDVLSLLLVDEVETIGELELAAKRSMIEIDADDRALDAMVAPIAAVQKWQTPLGALRIMHARLYNVFGDPAMRIARPGLRVTDVRLDDDILSGTVEGMVKGMAMVFCETPRDKWVNTWDVQTIDGPNDPELPRKAAINFGLANARDMKLIERQVENGRFEVRLIDALPKQVGVLRVYAYGVDADGREVEAIGGARLRGQEDLTRSRKDAKIEE